MSTFTYKSLTALALAGALLAAPAFAEEAHHPQGSDAPAAAAPAGPAGQGMGMMGGKDMGKMHEMMQKMHAAKTPEERQKLRAEHHKAMQGKMGMMRQGMQNSQCPMAKDDAAQQQCMKEMHENMQGMMQMMEQMMEGQSMANGQ
ncbi:MAG: hypothetical protein Q7J43_15395 [Pseudomonas sp.]|uniref:hypothetical protein n=1 Tax=Pseudomonas sp. TaxID=306 RepID=UPI0027176768|nr:hypothetical protein [Pseudomonas sp.]MDO9619049.1 hypothetical protein [Pseudomonas sp.]